MAAKPAHIFGIRHHGPGSARSLAAALQELRPDALLVEGPPDAAEVLPLVAHAEMQPPVALLIYAPDTPRKAVYYPFSHFSPEWVALRYGFANGITVRFIDLAQSHQLAGDTNDLAPESAPPDPIRADPLGTLARAAGYDDSERWWDRLVEQRRDSRDLFPAILEAMTALREMAAPDDSPNGRREQQREATMRQAIRAAQKDGFERIAVVCGAWHAPALVALPPASHDNALLKGLPKIKVAATWIPWTHSHLTRWSGYGAGIRSPGWYQHLWEQPERIAAGWLAKTAQLLRDQDYDASTAQVIDAVRLAETLAAIRGYPTPGLDELLEVTRTVLCFGSDKPFGLIDQKLIVGERMGTVPDEAPTIPLQQDLQREQRRLTMRPEAESSTLNLDLRKPIHLERSHLLHRLLLLGVGWGQKENVANKSGTFHEVWELKWRPELVIALIEKGIWGNTVEEAATAYIRDTVEKTSELAPLTELVKEALLADLSDAIQPLVRRLQDVAALTEDVKQLLASLPPLADVYSYSDVRRTEAALVGPVIDGLVARVWVGLPGACTFLSDEAAQDLFNQIIAFDGALRLLQNDVYLDMWYHLLGKLTESDAVHGLISGRCCRILFDSKRLTIAAVGKLMQRETSAGKEPASTTAWLEGFLGGSGTILTHHRTFLQIVDEWLAALDGELFVNLLPLLRRTFSSFSEPERRQIGEAVRGGRGKKRDQIDPESITRLDPERSRAVLPTVAKLLGLKES